MIGPHYPRALRTVWSDCKANASALGRANVRDKPYWRVCLQSTLLELRDARIGEST